MASSVKRFITHHLYWFSIFLFVGLISLNVKTAYAQTYKDEVIGLTLPYELNLKKTGPVRLAGLLYQAESNQMENLVSIGDKVRLSIVSNKPDRYGRKSVHLYDNEGHWIQGELVRQGHAIPYPFAGEEEQIRALYMLEKPSTMNALDNNIPTKQFAIIEGLVIAVTEVKGTTYLNFGDNWRTDFTVRISKKNLKKIKASGLNLPMLKGQNIRIRGWVIEQNGPMIEAEHPAQIEVPH